MKYLLIKQNPKCNCCRSCEISSRRQTQLMLATNFPMKCHQAGALWDTRHSVSQSLSPPLRDLWDWLNHISRDTGTVSSIPIYLSFLKYSRNSCRFLNTQCLEIFERKTFLVERVWLTYSQSVFPLHVRHDGTLFLGRVSQSPSPSCPVSAVIHILFHFIHSTKTERGGAK